MIKIAIDLGSTMTKIYRADAGNGIVLAEPSCVAVGGDGTEVKAIGKEAKQLVGKTAEFTRIVFPVYEGVIVDDRLAVIMLKEFLSRAGIKASKVKRAEAVFAVPCGASEEWLDAYRALAQECGLRKVYFVETPYLSVLGSDDAVLSEADPVFTLNIGGGVTNAAVLSLGGIVSARSLSVGGDALERAIIESVRANYNLVISERMAEDLKKNIGSAYPLEQEMTMEIKGRDAMSGLPRAMIVRSEEVREAMLPSFKTMAQAIHQTLEHCPPEISGNLIDRGAAIAGGGALIRGLDRYFSDFLGLPFFPAEDPLFAVVQGTGISIENSDWNRPRMR